MAVSRKRDVAMHVIPAERLADQTVGSSSIGKSDRRLTLMQPGEVAHQRGHLVVWEFPRQRLVAVLPLGDTTVGKAGHRRRRHAA